MKWLPLSPIPHFSTPKDGNQSSNVSAVFSASTCDVNFSQTYPNKPSLTTRTYSGSLSPHFNVTVVEVNYLVGLFGMHGDQGAWVLWYWNLLQYSEIRMIRTTGCLLDPFSNERVQRQMSG